MKTTAQRLREARKAARLSQHDLVLLTGYSQGHIAQVELGTRIPSERCLRVLAEALGAPVEKLRGGEATSADFDRGFEQTVRWYQENGPWVERALRRSGH